MLYIRYFYPCSLNKFPGVLLEDYPVHTRVSNPDVNNVLLVNHTKSLVVYNRAWKVIHKYTPYI